MNQTSCWLNGHRPEYGPAAGNLKVDALVVGGGIAGVTAAHLLKKAGVSVALVEKGRIGGAETGYTTAHISYPTDVRLSALVEQIGENHAQAVWDAGAAAAAQIEANVRAGAMDCEWTQVPAYLFASFGADPDEIPRLKKEARLAQRLSFDAFYTDSAPVVQRPALGFPNLAKFHPLKYLSALAEQIPGAGSHLFENSAVAEFHESPRHATGTGFFINYDQLFVATHVPILGHRDVVSAALLQTKLAAYSTYAMGARLPAELPQALWWDTDDPYLYLRIDRRPDGAYAIIGGEDHKTGQESDSRSHFHALQEKLRGILPDAEPDCRWSGQVIETLDGLPYIGETRSGTYVATGFSGTGMTFGTLAGMMFRDHVLGKRNPWQELFSVSRKRLSDSWNYLRENSDYPYYLAKGLLTGTGDGAAEALLCGEGRIVRRGGRKVAAYRDAAGKLWLLSPVCPHLGCTVHWNKAEHTWDCPCHGSRFEATGAVRGGPAEHPLKHLELPD